MSPPFYEITQSSKGAKVTLGVEDKELIMEHTMTRVITESPDAAKNEIDIT